MMKWPGDKIKNIFSSEWAGLRKTHQNINALSEPGSLDCAFFFFILMSLKKSVE